MERRTVSARNYSMATIAERLLPADEFVLSYTLDTLGNADFEIERLVVHDSEEVMPCVGTTGVDADELESASAEDPSVGEIERTTDEAVSYRMHWVGSIETLVHVLLKEGTILVAEGDREGWFLRVLFPDRDSLSRAYGFCNQNDLSLGIRRIYDQ